MEKGWIVNRDDRILITGSNGFIGSHLVEALLRLGFNRIRCFVRPSSNLEALRHLLRGQESGKIEVFKGNLLSRENCLEATRDAKVIYHLAVGIEKTYAGSYMNSVVPTRNLLEAGMGNQSLRRFVNVSSFSIYSPREVPRGAVIDETCQVDPEILDRCEPYAFTKLKQDELVIRYSQERGVPYVILRPGTVYGPGNRTLTGRVGLGTFGFFLHLGGSGLIPLTYVENCADAIALAGIKVGIENEAFNIVDDELPSSREFLRFFKKNAGGFPSIYLPYPVFYLFCCFWESFSRWSDGQLPPVFNRKRCATYWRGHRYSNEKLKKKLGWRPRVSYREACERFAQFLRLTSEASKARGG